MTPALRFARISVVLLLLFPLCGQASAERFGIPRGSFGRLFPEAQQNSKNSVASESLSSTRFINPATSEKSSQPDLPTGPAAIHADNATKTASQSSVMAQASQTRQTTALANPSGRRQISRQALAASDAKALPNVVRLISFDNKGQSFGSGSYIGNFEDYGLILSNWHVVCEADGLVHIHFPGGFSSFGSVLLSDKKWDLALIVISKPPQAIPSMAIARQVPKPGDSLWIAGHGSGYYRLAGGNCVRYLAPEVPKNGNSPQYEIIELSVSARQGDSGGPILNKDGELAGVLFGSDMIRNTAGSYCLRVNRFLSQARSELDQLPKQPESRFVVVEPNGPKRQLQDTVHVVPSKALLADNAPRRSSDLVGTGGFGVRSPSRRYTQAHPSSVNIQGIAPDFPANLSDISTDRSQSTPEALNDRGQNNEVPDKESDSLRPASATGTFGSPKSVRAAVWNPSSDLSRRSERAGDILQTASALPGNMGRDNGDGGNIGSSIHSNARSILSIPGPFDQDLSTLNPNTFNAGSSGSDRLGSPKAYQPATPSGRYSGSSTPHTRSDQLRYDVNDKKQDATISAALATPWVLRASVFIVFVAIVLSALSLRVLRNEKNGEGDSSILIRGDFLNKNDRKNESNAA